ncbi:MAG TPA: metal-dependent hydrolase [Agitococcus sp.]|nr:metal-dependent hydrolase [Agitococcus sp.]
MNTSVSNNIGHTTAAPATKKLALGATVNIPPRRLDFEFSTDSERYYYDNNPYLSSFLTTLSSLFPAGESFFVEAVRHYRERITDPVLKAQVAGFIGQEAMHSKEHQGFNDMATRQGYPVDKLDRDVTKLLDLVQKTLPKPVQLAATVALEHYTAIIAEMLLRDADVQQKFSVEARHLWLWHALEENEHKTVAYDVYQQMVGSYGLRVATMALTTVIFFAVTFAFHTRMLAADGQLFKFRQNWDAFKYCWNGKKGVFSRLLPQYLDFFKPSFHPKDHDTDALLAQWKEILFAKEDGVLYEQLKNKSAVGVH